MSQKTNAYSFNNKLTFLQSPNFSVTKTTLTVKSVPLISLSLVMSCSMAGSVMTRHLPSLSTLSSPITRLEGGPV